MMVLISNLLKIPTNHVDPLWSFYRQHTKWSIHLDSFIKKPVNSKRLTEPHWTTHSSQSSFFRQLSTLK